MSIRDNTMAKFGPHLLEAMVANLLEEINILRVAQGLPEKTLQSFFGTCNNHMNHQEPYDWNLES